MNQESLQVSGRKVSQVVCEKCETVYYFILGRIGESVLEAFVDYPSIRRQHTAQEVLETRLAGEAELVPCPNCCWISQPLVDGYAKTVCYRWYRSIYMTLLVSGVLAAIAILPNGLDSPLGLVMALFALPIVIIFICYYSLRIWLFRRRFQPNQKYPDFPILPPGTPAALVEQDGALIPAETKSQFLSQEVSFDDSLDFQVGRDELPNQCIQCLDFAQNNDPLVVPVYGSFSSTKVELKVPFCSNCRNERVWQLNQFSGVISMLFSGVIAGGAWYFGCGIYSLLVFVVSLLFSWLLLLELVKNLIKVVDARLIDTARGVMRVKFRSAEYQKLVLKINRR